MTSSWFFLSRLEEVKSVWCAQVHLPGHMNVMLGCPSCIWIDSLFAMSAMACSLTERENLKDRMLTSFIFHVWFDVCLWGRQLHWDVRFSQLWMLDEWRATKSCWCWNQKLSVLEPKVVVLEPKVVGAGTKSCWCWNQKLWCWNLSEWRVTERAERLPIPPYNPREPSVPTTSYR